jgi:hypothetical protein
MLAGFPKLTMTVILVLAVLQTPMVYPNGNLRAELGHRLWTDRSLSLVHAIMVTESFAIIS